MRERGDGEHRAERERRAKIEKQKGREFRVFWFKAFFKRCILHLFIIFYNLNFSLNWSVSTLYLNQPALAVSADMTRIGMNRPDSARIGKRKKKSMWHRRTGGGVARCTPHRAASNADAAPL